MADRGSGSVQGFRHRGVAAFVAVAAAALVVSGCSTGDAGGADAHTTTHHKVPVTPSKPTHKTKPVHKQALPATLTASVKANATDVPVDTPVSVSSRGGQLTSVSFTGPDGHALAGRFNADKTTWTASEFLDPDVHYTLQSQAVNPEGKVTRATQGFSTQSLTLDQQTYPSVSPLAGQVMGIGMPVIVHFDVAVTNHAEFQRHMFVTSTPAQPGTWHWVSDHEVHWRPKTYWQPGTKVHVDLELNGVNAGDGIYGQVDRIVDFSIGRSVLIKANMKTDEMAVLVNGKVARTIPITGGEEPAYTTRSGIKLISQKYNSIRMNSATVGIDPDSPEGYDLPAVRYAMRVTDSGEFLHAAPWSIYAQGHENVSHGCVGMSTANAHWLFDLAEVGTPVEVTGTNRPLESGNGWTDWNESWAQYKAASALK